MQAYSTAFSSHSVIEGKTYQFPRRSIMPALHTYLWQVEAGVVRSLTWLEDGVPVMLGLCGPEEIVGPPLSKADPYQIETITPVEAKAIAFRNWSPSKEQLLSHAQQSEALMLLRASASAEERLLRALSWLARKFGDKIDHGYLITPQFTHQDLGELVGLTRVTVTRSLSQLEQQGMIQRQSRRLVLLKEEGPWYYEI